MPAKEMVLVEHPDLPETKKQPSRVSRPSFERLWKAKGWKLHTPQKEK